MAESTPFFGGYSETQSNRPGWQRFVDFLIPGNLNNYRDLFGRDRTMQDRIAGAAGVLGGAGGAAGLLGRVGGRAARRAQENTPQWRFRDMTPEDREALGVNSPEELEARWAGGTSVGNYLHNGYNVPFDLGGSTPVMPSFNPTVTIRDVNDAGNYYINPTTGQVSQVTMPAFSQWPTAPSTSGDRFGINMPYLQPNGPSTAQEGLPGITSPLEGSGYGPSAAAPNSDYRAGLARGVNTAGGFGRAPGSSFGVFHGVGGQNTSPIAYQGGMSTGFSPYIEQ